MATRKIRDIAPCDRRFSPCRHPEHDLPNMMCFHPGVYEHECPGCGRTFQFTVYPHHTLQVPKDPNARIRTTFNGRQDIHYVDVGNMPTAEVPAYIERVREGFFIPVRN